MRLALARGVSLKQLLRDTDSAELSEWIAYYKLEPFGQEWLQTASIMAATLAPHRKTPPNPVDFLPVKPPEREQSDEEMLAIFKALADRQQGKIT